MATRAAGYVIFRDMNSIREYLLLQASYEPYHWTPPKGHVDPGENELQAAIRELREESGIEKSHITIIPDFKKVVEYQVKNNLKTVTYYIAKLNNPEHPVKLSDEHKDYAWLPIERACDVSAFKTSRELLLSCDEYLTKNNNY